MRFEYKTVTVRASAWSGNVAKGAGKIEAELNALGALGWELVGVSTLGLYTQAFLKRAK